MGWMQFWRTIYCSITPLKLTQTKLIYISISLFFLFKNLTIFQRSLCKFDITKEKIKFFLLFIDSIFFYSYVYIFNLNIKLKS